MMLLKQPLHGVWGGSGHYFGIEEEYRIIYVIYMW